MNNKLHGERIRGGCGAIDDVAAPNAHTVAPLESRISGYPCNTSRDLAAPYTTAFTSRAV